MEFTGSTKYPGFSRELLFVSATGEFAARRAMPTSGARGVWTCGGGQSAGGSSRLPLHQPFSPRAGATASVCGSGLIGQKGRSCTAGGVAGRRRFSRIGVVWGRTGDIAHLEPAQYFAFLSPCQALFFSFLSPSLRHVWRQGFRPLIVLWPIFRSARASCEHRRERHALSGQRGCVVASL